MAPRSRSGCGLDSIPAAFLSHAPGLRQGLEDRLQCCAEDGGFLLHEVRINPAKGLEVLAVGSAGRLQPALLDAGTEAGVHYHTAGDRPAHSGEEACQR
ncbi:MAG: hypothetical protein ACREEC_13845, partial [Thermoplasmata archaeon]